MAGPIISGPALIALHSLDLDEIAFLQGLPKAELHAHLHGSIPLQTLRHLAANFSPSPGVEAGVAATISRLQSDVVLTEISDFFSLFPAIYALIATPAALAEATRDVLEAFLIEQPPPSGFAFQPAPDCSYLELRSTPRKTSHMTREQYLLTVLQEIRAFPGRAALIVSVDRRMSAAEIEECVDLAIKLHEQGEPIVGLDLCGDPLKGNVDIFEKHFERAREAGLSLTVHIAETKPIGHSIESFVLLSWHPDRLGHATFLEEPQREIFLADIPPPNIEMPQIPPPNGQVPDPIPHHHRIFYALWRKHLLLLSQKYQEAGVHTDSPDDTEEHAAREVAKEIQALRELTGGQYKPCIELCLSSNLLCKSVTRLDEHHIRHYLVNNHPIVICTDDILPFRTTLLAEYAFLLAKPPYGLGLSRSEVRKIGQMGMNARFMSQKERHSP
ncbi:Metallo-dependent hydrolase [Butyriboletus roseoflavus]|nr:Metallo-dependent hydrolase [Butyriboletus roseoflavus]